MPLNISEERDGRVSVWILSDPFTANELSDAIDHFQDETLSKATKKIYMICDLTQVKHLPPNVMSAGLKMMKKKHPMSGPIIEVTSNGFVSAIMSAFAKLTPNGMISVCTSLETAFEEVDRRISLEPKENMPENLAVPRD